MLLRRSLNAVTFDSEGSVQLYILKVLDYRSQLAHMSQAMSDEDVISHLLVNLLDSWMFIQTSITGQPDKIRTLDYVISALNGFETDMKAKLERTTTEKPLTNALLATANT